MARNRMSFAERPLAGMAGWLISKGLVKTESQANIVLIAIIVACIIIGYWALHRDSASRGGKRMPPNTYYGQS